MRKAMTQALFLLMALLVPYSVRGQVGVSVGVNVALPPPIVFNAPPEVVVLPESNVYVVPDVEADIYFSGGWWWRPWQGHWYRSRYYDRGWAFYGAAPPHFYRRVPPGWRNDYRDHRWQGREWHHQRIRHDDMQRNWRGWERERHWQQPHPGRGHGPGPGPVGPRGPQGPVYTRGPAPMPGPGAMHSPGPMRGPGPAPAGGRGYQPGPQGRHPGGFGPAAAGGRGFQPGPQGPRPGGPPGQNRGPGPGWGHDNRGGHGRR